jgi:hypothetical protein
MIVGPWLEAFTFPATSLNAALEIPTLPPFVASLIVENSNA